MRLILSVSVKCNRIPHSVTWPYLRRHLGSEQSLGGGPVMQFVRRHRRAFDQPSAYDPKPTFDTYSLEIEDHQRENKAQCQFE